MLVSEYEQQLTLEQRILLEDLRYLIFRTLALSSEIYEVVVSGVLTYVHDFAVMCRVDFQGERIFVHLVSAQILDKYRNQLQNIDIEGGQISFKCSRELPLDAIRSILKETAQDQENHWFKILENYTGTKRALCLNITSIDFEILNINLKAFGFQVLGPVQGVEGLEMARQERPDVIFFDPADFIHKSWVLFDQAKADVNLEKISIVALLPVSPIPRPLREWGRILPDETLIKPFAPVHVARVLCKALNIGESWKRVASILDDYGTTITASLNKDSNEQEAARIRGHAALDELRHYKGKKLILCIDIDRAGLVQRTLEHANDGFTVKQVIRTNNDDELTTIKREKPDLVLISVDLPCEGAWDILDRIKSDNTLGNTRVIGVVPRVVYQEPICSLRGTSGAFMPDAFLPRNFDSFELGRTLCEALGIDIQ